MEMLIDFPGGVRVDAHVNGHTVHTDQPPQGGGQDSAPSPFVHFLASIGTCAGIYVLGFCRNRGLPTDGISLRQSSHYDRQTGMVSEVELEIALPPDFPERYREPLIRSVELCAVKKHLEDPPEFSIRTVVQELAIQG